jgi:hypothetical protein
MRLQACMFRSSLRYETAGAVEALLAARSVPDLSRLAQSMIALVEHTCTAIEAMELVWDHWQCSFS